jgi:DNA-binding NarL/FixJ family response regulator
VSPISRRQVACVDDDPIHGKEFQTIVGGELFRRVEDLDGTSWALVVCDLILPHEKLSGVDAIEHLVREGHRVAAWSTLAPTEMICDAIAAGALTYAEKKPVWDDPRTLAQAVGAAARGEPFITQALAAQLVQDALRRPLPAHDLGAAARQSLDEIMSHGPVPQPRRRLVDEIWNVAALRRAFYHVELTEKDRRILPLLEVGYTIRAIASQTGYKEDDIYYREKKLAAEADEIFGKDPKGWRTRGGKVRRLYAMLRRAVGASPH